MDIDIGQQYAVKGNFQFCFFCLVENWIWGVILLFVACENKHPCVYIYTNSSLALWVESEYSSQVSVVLTGLQYFNTTQCYLLPSWWCHPYGLALLPRDCCPVGSPAQAACSSLPPYGFRQTSKTPHRWTGRSCRCGPRWRLPPPCPPSPRSFCSCSIQRWAEDSQSWPLCPWRPSIEILERWRKVCEF